MDEDLDKDNEDEDSFESLEKESAIDPSAIINSFLGTDSERPQVHPRACTESLADLSDGVLELPVIIFWLLEDHSLYVVYVSSSLFAHHDQLADCDPNPGQQGVLPGAPSKPLY